jgi:acyl carrier protein
LTGADQQAAILSAMTGIVRRLCADPGLSLSPAQRLEDIPGLDSLRTLQAVALLEEQFDVVVDVVALDDIHTVGDVMLVISRAQQAG